MTCVPLGPENWQLELSEPEGLFLITIFTQLADHYREELEQLPPALRGYWQGNRAVGEEQEGMETSREILTEMREELRSERLALTEYWIHAYETAEQRDPWRVELSRAQKDELMALVNDRRLLLALQFDLTEEEVEQDLLSIPEENRRTALWQIHLLGQLIFILIGRQIYRP